TGALVFARAHSQPPNVCGYRCCHERAEPVMSTEPAAARAYIEVLHITDSHLTRDASGALLGVNTRDSLNAVLELIRKDDVRPDFLIASGDLAQDGSVEAYRYFEQSIAGWECPKSWFPGNHDNRANMAQVVAASGVLDK